MKKIICILGTMLAALLLMACNGMSFSGSRLGNDLAYYEVQHI